MAPQPVFGGPAAAAAAAAWTVAERWGARIRQAPVTAPPTAASESAASAQGGSVNGRVSGDGTRARTFKPWRIPDSGAAKLIASMTTQSPI